MTHKFLRCMCERNEVSLVLIVTVQFHQHSSVSCLWGTTVKVEIGDSANIADPSDAQSVCRSFPLTYGEPLVHFLTESSKAPNAHAIRDQATIK